MGGRGAASGTSAAAVKYGEEYRSVFRAGNIKFLVRNVGAQNVPLETMAADKGRVYVALGKGGGLKSIAQYDKDGRRTRQIDLDHPHRGEQPHAHTGYVENRKDAELTAADKRLIRRVEKAWQIYKTTA